MSAVKIRGKSWTQLFLQDYGLQVTPVSRAARAHLELKSGWFSRFFLDFLICYFVIGFFMVAYWRSAWLAADQVFGTFLEVKGPFTLFKSLKTNVILLGLCLFERDISCGGIRRDFSPPFLSTFHSGWLKKCPPFKHPNHKDPIPGTPF